MVMRGPKVTRVIKIGTTKIGVVAWWEKRGKKAGCVRLAVWRNSEPAQSIIADYNDYPLRNKEMHSGKLSRISFALSAEEQARRIADTFIRRLGLALQNSLTELYQDFQNASFWLNPKDALTAACWFNSLRRIKVSAIRRACSSADNANEILDSFPLCISLLRSG
jgi:hypothetical protein